MADDASSGRGSVLFGRDALRIPPIPAVEGREIAGVPGLAESGRAQVPVGPALTHDRPQILAEVLDRGAAPEPVAVVDAVDDETRL